MAAGSVPAAPAEEEGGKKTKHVKERKNKKKG